jgi:hypothetical protein
VKQFSISAHMQNNPNPFGCGGQKKHGFVSWYARGASCVKPLNRQEPTRQRRIGAEVLRRSFIADVPLLQDVEAVGQGERELQVLLRQQDCHFFRRETRDLFLQPVTNSDAERSTAWLGW